MKKSSQWPRQFMDKQSEKYQAAVKALEDLLEESDGDLDVVNRAYAEAVAEKIYDRIASKRKRVGLADVCVDRLAGRRCRNIDCPNLAGGDHLSEWIDENGERSIISQPYSLDVMTTAEFCRQHGLYAEVDAWRSWHFPGNTLRATFRKAQ